MFGDIQRVAVNETKIIYLMLKLLKLLPCNNRRLKIETIIRVTDSSDFGNFAVSAPTDDTA